jgi:ABC-type uncharacterized transport system permease subunit
MHEMSVVWLRAATVLYAVGLAHAFAVMLFRSTRLYGYALSALRAGILLHCVALVELGIALRHLPADNFYETSSLCGLLLALLYLFVNRLYRFESLSLIFFPLIFLMTLIGAMEFPSGTWSSPRVRDAWLLFHVLAVLVGYAGLLLTAAGSVFYLIQERRLKTKQSLAVFEKLPPLGTLDKLISRSMTFGFIFITLALIAGTIWAYVEIGTRWITEPKIVVSLATWFFFLVMVYLRVSAGWRGRKAAVMAITVLGFSALTWAAHVGLRPLIAP